MQSTFIYTINLFKPYLFQSSNDTGCSVGLRQTNEMYIPTWGGFELFWQIYLTLNTKQDFWDYFNIMNIWFDSVMLATWWTSKHSHMDHCIGCHAFVFTVAYAVLWSEVQLHIKVFRIRRTTTQGGESPLPFLENHKKCPGFGKKGPDFIHPEVKFTIQNIV